MRFSQVLAELYQDCTAVECVLIGLGVLVLPSYLFQFKLGHLFSIIQGLAQGERLSTFFILQTFTETGLIVFALFKLVPFFMRSSVSAEHSKFKGYHQGLQFTSIPEHLIAPEIIIEDEENHMPDEMLENIPTLEELLSQNGELSVEPAEDLFKYYESMYLNDQNQQSGPKTTADILKEKGVDINELLNQINNESQ